MNVEMQKLGAEHSAIREIFEQANARALQIGRENVFDFSLGNPNVPAPDCVQEELKRLVSEMPPERLHGYSSAAGLPEVRERVADYLRGAFGANARAELIYMTCGASSSLTATFGGILNRGEEVLVLAPYFPEYRVFISQAGGLMKPVRTDENFHIDAQAVEAAITPKTRAIVVNSPNNPSGAVYGAAELQALCKVLSRKSAEYGARIFLIADEPYRELTYGADVPYLMNFYADTVVCYSFSKSLSLAGERIGFAAVNADMEGAKDVFAAISGAARAAGYVCAPTLFQRVCAHSLGKTGELSVYGGNRALIYGALADMGYACNKPEGAFYLFVKSPEPSAAAFCARAKKYGLFFVPSDSFGVEGYARIAYCVKRETIERSLPAFRALAKEYGLVK